MKLEQVIHLEELQTDAIDRLKRGLRPEARERLRKLIREYQSDFPGMRDALLVLHFNLFIATLDQHEAIPLNGVIDGLINAYEGLERPSSSTLEVSRQLSMWLAQTPPEVTEALDIHAEQRSVLESLVARDFDSPCQLRDFRFVLEAHIRPSTIAQLSPIDSGLLCFSIARQGSSMVTLPRWMRKLYRLQLSLPQLPLEVEDALSRFQETYQQREYAEAYRALLTAFEWAVFCAPPFAFEWVIGLVQLEAHEEVEHLSYLLSLPLERRVTLTIKLHRDFARLLADERDAERLALHHWQEVIALGQHHRRVIDHRHRELSTHLNEDLETKGWLRVRIAEGLIAQGDDLSAFKYLEEVVSKARIDTYQDRFLAATALSLSGMISERLGKLDEASERYYLALSRALPRPILNHQDIAIVEQWYFRSHDEQSDARLLLGIKRSADLIRMTAHPEALSDLDLLHTLISSLSTQLPYEELQEAVIYLGLTYAYFDEVRGARRALEAAQAIDHTSGIALSNLYLIKFEEKATQHDPEQLKRVRQTYERVLKEVEGARGGDVQRQLQLHSAILFLQRWVPVYRDMEADQRRRFKDQVTAQLRRAYESFCQRTLRGHLCQFSVLLPMIPPHELEEVIHALYRIGLTEASRWLIKILRGEDHPYYFVSPRQEFALEIKEVHRRRFEHQWILNEEQDYRSFMSYDLLSSRRDTPAWPQRALNPQEARLEFFVFDDWLMAFMFVSGQMVGRRLEVNRRELEDEVFDLLECLTRDEEPVYVMNERCQALYQLLIDPFASEIEDLHRLIISPDDILTLVPFSALLDPQQRYLGQRLEVAIALSTADPIFSSITARRGQAQIYFVSEESSGETLSKEISSETGSTRSLQFSALNVEEWESSQGVGFHDQRYDRDYQESAMVIFDGELREAGEVYFYPSESREEASAELHVSDLVRSLVKQNTNSCLFTHNISPFIVPTKSLKTLLTSVHGGVIHCRWPTSFQDQLLERLVSRLTVGSQLIGMMSALTHLRRTAIQERRGPREWACFELYVAQHQLE